MASLQGLKGQRRCRWHFPGCTGRVAGAPISHDLGQYCRSLAANDTSMAFDPRQLSLLEVAGVVTIILSAVLLAGVVYSIW